MNHFWLRVLLWTAGLAAVTVLLVVLLGALIPPNSVSHDFIQFWTAGVNVAAGRSPYDAKWQATIQQQLGWDKATRGLGVYGFLPYYYPPWLALVCTLFVPLGYETGRVAWFVVNLELLILAGYLLRRSVEGVPRWIPVVIVPVFTFSIVALLMGQVAALLVFLIAAVWRLADSRWDRSAGAVLVWLTIKPQLTLVLLVAVLAWSVRRRRWGIVRGFAGGLLAILLVSGWAVPAWPYEMLQATKDAPLVTVAYPWVGTTWMSLAGTIGLGGWSLWLVYASGAVPLVILALQTALDRSRPIADVLATSLLAAFFVAPYARYYDFPVLIVPTLALLAGRTTDRQRALLLLFVMVLPLAHFLSFPPTRPLAYQVTFFWLPSALTAAWLALKGWPSAARARLIAAFSSSFKQAAVS